MKKKVFLFFTLVMLVSLAMGLGVMTASAADTSVTQVSGEITWTTDSEGYLYGTANGEQLVGWVESTSGNRYYFTRSSADAPFGSAAVGLTAINGYRYYFDENGVMQTGWQTINGDSYYFYMNDGTNKVKGSMATGLVKISSRKYYFSADGVMQTGWQTIGKYRYYFYKNNGTKKVKGAMATGLVKIGSYKYYFDSNGRAKKNSWVTISKKKYYFGSNYRMKTGCWIKVGKYYYYVNKNGVMQTSCVTGSSSKGYGYVNSQGRRTTTTDKNAAAMVKKAQSYSSSTKYLILVNSTTNKVGIFTGKKGNWTLKYYWTCATGKASSPTVKGSYTITGRGKSFGTSTYTCWYYTQFYGNYLFHSILYSPGSMSKVVESGLGTNASHGCVRLALSNAKWIYTNIPNRTKVISY